MKTKLKFAFVLVFFSVMAGVTAVTASYFFTKELPFIEEYIYASRFSSAKYKNKQVVIVTISEKTVSMHNAQQLRRSDYAEVISQILKGNPKVLGIDIVFSGVKDVADDRKLIDVLSVANIDTVLAVEPEEDENLILNKAILTSNAPFKNNKIYIGNVKSSLSMFYRSKMKTGSSLMPVSGINGKEYLPFPILIASKFLNADYKQFFSEEEYRFIVAIGNVQIPMSGYYDWGYRKRWHGDAMFVNYIGNIEAFDTIPFEKVLEASPIFFQNKIVLIGTVQTHHDKHITPVSSETSGVVILANTIHTIINDQIVSYPDFEFQIIGILFFCFVFSIAIYYLPSVSVPFITIFIVVVFKIFTDFIFSSYQIYLPFVPLMLCVVINCIVMLVVKIAMKRIARRQFRG